MSDPQALHAVLLDAVCDDESADPDDGAWTLGDTAANWSPLHDEHRDADR
jgi:hypothetical protein